MALFSFGHLGRMASACLRPVIARPASSSEGSAQSPTWGVTMSTRSAKKPRWELGCSPQHMNHTMCLSKRSTLILKCVIARMHLNFDPSELPGVQVKRWHVLRLGSERRVNVFFPPRLPSFRVRLPACCARRLCVCPCDVWPTGMRALRQRRHP